MKQTKSSISERARCDKNTSQKQPPHTEQQAPETTYIKISERHIVAGQLTEIKAMIDATLRTLSNPNKDVRKTDLQGILIALERTVKFGR